MPPTRPVVNVVGLGPAGAEFVLPAAQQMLIAPSSSPVLFRTARHPAAADLMGRLRVGGGRRDVRSFDYLYEEGTSFAAVYASIVDSVVAEAATHGEVIYAVPGSPTVAERTVDMLLALETIELRLVPGLSFCDLAWARLRIDPLAEGVRLLDGLSFGWQAAGDPGPLLVGQCWSNSVLSEVKLALEEPAESQHAVILHHLGMDDEVVVDVPWQEIDRTVEADHLTSLFVPALDTPVAAEIMRLVDTIASLRRLCPWDREQTHGSLVRHLLEETYEAVEAIEALGERPESACAEVVSHAEEELGDLLCQVVFHSVLAREEGLFDLFDVARSNREKLVGRHPHVFGDVRADTAGAVVRNWELIKEGERPGAGLLAGIPAAMAALARVAKVERKLSSVGLGWADTASFEDRQYPQGDEQPASADRTQPPHVEQAAGDRRPDASPDGHAAGARRPDTQAPGDRRPDASPDEQAAGDSLLALARELSATGIDPESALRHSLDRLAARVREVEEAAARGGTDLRGAPPDDRVRWFRDGPPSRRDNG